MTRENILEQRDREARVEARETRDDFNLCFLCMRWSSGDPDCLAGHRCDLQLILDELDRHPQPLQARAQAQ